MNNRYPTFFALFVLLGTLAYGIFQWNEREVLLIESKSLSTQVSTLTSESKGLVEKYQSIKSDVNAERETYAQELSLVFPTSEDLTMLTRLFDDFSVKNNFSTNPFFISSISYDEAELDSNGSYRYVPVNLTVTSSKKNLSKFLEFIESSGSFEGEVRLMSVNSMGLRYPEKYGGTYEANILIYAYFSEEI